MGICLQDYGISITLCHNVFLVDLVNETNVGRVLNSGGFRGGGGGGGRPPPLISGFEFLFFY